MPCSAPLCILLLMCSAQTRTLYQKTILIRSKFYSHNAQLGSVCKSQRTCGHAHVAFVLSHLDQGTNYRRQSLLATKGNQYLSATEIDASVCQFLFATESDGSVCVCLENKTDEATGTSHIVQPVCAELLVLAFLHHLILYHSHSCCTLFHSSQIHYSCRTRHLDGERHLPETDVAFFARTSP